MLIQGSYSSESALSTLLTELNISVIFSISYYHFFSCIKDYIFV